VEAIPCCGTHKRAVSEIAFRRIWGQNVRLSKLLPVWIENDGHALKRVTGVNTLSYRVMPAMVGSSSQSFLGLQYGYEHAGLCRRWIARLHETLQDCLPMKVDVVEPKVVQAIKLGATC
jgi:hypothetical protein